MRSKYGFLIAAASLFISACSNSGDTTGTGGIGGNNTGTTGGTGGGMTTTTSTIESPVVDLKALNAAFSNTCKKSIAAGPDYTGYLCKLRIPADHNDPNAGSAWLPLEIQYRGPNKPLHLFYTGYDLNSSYLGVIYQLTGAFEGGANQVVVGTRFYDVPATPVNANWNKQLRPEQIAADYDLLMQTLMPLFPTDTRVNSGISQGGIYALLHDYYYPGTFAATVAIATPVSLDGYDSRYGDYIAMDRPDCQPGIKAYQEAVLKQRAQIGPIATEGGYTYNQVQGVDNSISFALEDAPWGILSYEDCIKVPDPNKSTLVDLLNYQGDFEPIQLASDQILGTPLVQAAYFAQATWEGWGNVNIDFLVQAGLVPNKLWKPQDYIIPGPNKDPKIFDPEPAQKLYDWSKTVNNVIAICGADDPWCAGVIPGKHVYVIPGKNHLTTDISALGPQLNEVLTLLSELTGQPTQAPQPPPPQARRKLSRMGREALYNAN